MKYKTHSEPHNLSLVGLVLNKTNIVTFCTALSQYMHIIRTHEISQTAQTTFRFSSIDEY